MAVRFSTIHRWDFFASVVNPHLKYRFSGALKLLRDLFCNAPHLTPSDEKFDFLLKVPNFTKLSVLCQLYTALCTVSEVYAIFFSCARTIFKKKIYLCSLKHYVNI
jgi:hypothetical protein